VTSHFFYAQALCLRFIFLKNPLKSCHINIGNSHYYGAFLHPRRKSKQKAEIITKVKL